MLVRYCDPAKTFINNAYTLGFMNIQGQHYRTIWLDDSKERVVAIDQRELPHMVVVDSYRNVDSLITAIKDMHVRGAGLIGAAAGYGAYLAMLDAKEKGTISVFMDHCKNLISARPTAVNLAWAVNRQMQAVDAADTLEGKVAAALKTAEDIANEDAECCRRIGLHGVKIIERLSRKKQGDTVNILTHCNAGWLAFVDYGSATSPIYAAFEKGIKLHVWVDETRPRNQGAGLTAWELGQQGVPHTVIVDNAGGHLMQHGLVDMVITGADRVTRRGDVANKIGTYLKALAAEDNRIPFYVALPSSTFDWSMLDGVKEIPIEERDPDEVRYVSGWCDDIIDDNNNWKGVKRVLVMPRGSKAANYGFDVTPARLVTKLITERGICKADYKSIKKLFVEKIKK